MSNTNPPPGGFGPPAQPPQQPAPGYGYPQQPGPGYGYPQGSPGYPAAPPVGYPQAPGYGVPAQPSNGMGTTGLVLGIIGVVCSVTLHPVVLRRDPGDSRDHLRRHRPWQGHPR